MTEIRQSSTKEPVLEIEDLSLSYRNRQPLFHQLNLRLFPGKIVGLMGASGSGKSTLLRHLLNLNPKVVANKESKISLTTDQDRIVLNHSVDWQNIRGKEIGMIFQEPKAALDPSFKCRSQLIETIANRNPSLHLTEVKAQAESLMDRMGLSEEVLDRHPHEISGGEAQRVMIALATSIKPKILLADEPTTSLDSVNEKLILQHLRSLVKDDHLAILIVSHNRRMLEEFTDETYFLEGGKIHSSPADIDKELLGPISFSTKNEIVLEVKSLNYEVTTDWLGLSKKKILEGVSLQLHRGDVFGIVGESGSGKTTLLRSILRINRKSSGEIIFKGSDLNKANQKELRSLRKAVQLVGQDPLNSLNPRMSIQETLLEPLVTHGIGETNKERDSLVQQILKDVNLEDFYLKRYPNELSGGERQRVCIARALLVKPELLLLDEPVTSLDESVKWEIIDLLMSLKSQHNLTYIFVSHDFRLINFIANRVMVLTHGQVVEQGAVREVFQNPSNEYTRSLTSTLR